MVDLVELDNILYAYTLSFFNWGGVSKVSVNY